MRKNTIALLGVVVYLCLTTACNSVTSFIVEDTVQSAMQSTMTNGQSQSKTKRDKANDKAVRPVREQANIMRKNNRKIKDNGE